ncbi:MAG: YdeI/OmpD-associated family protein [Gemmatimonadales bacterium]
MAPLRFTARMAIRGINPYVLVSAVRAKRLKAGWRKPLPVLVRVNGHPKAKPWRINMMPVGDGSFYLYLHESVRRASKTGVGDTVRVEIGFDAAYRGGPTALPSWFRIPLSRNAAAKRAWGMLTPSRKKEIVRYLAALKSDEARERNVVRALRVLSGAKERFMARSW